MESALSAENRSCACFWIFSNSAGTPLSRMSGSGLGFSSRILRADAAARGSGVAPAPSLGRTSILAVTASDFVAGLAGEGPAAGEQPLTIIAKHHWAARGNRMATSAPAFEEVGTRRQPMSLDRANQRNTDWPTEFRTRFRLC